MYKVTIGLNVDRYNLSSIKASNYLVIWLLSNCTLRCTLLVGLADDWCWRMSGGTR
jgi:hypothetical protein